MDGTLPDTIRSSSPPAVEGTVGVVPRTAPLLAATLVHAARGLGILGTLAGAIIFAGWLYADLASMPGWIASIGTRTNAALGLLLVGASLLLLIPTEIGTARRWAGRACAGGVLLLGALTFTENVTDWNLGIDRLFATGPAETAGSMHGNRMGPPTALSFLVLGPTLWLLSCQGARTVRRALYQPLALLGILLALVPGIGHLYGANALYGITRYTGISWPTNAALLALAAGILCARPQQGLMAAITADDSGGRTIRRLLLPLLPAAIILGWLCLAGEHRGWYETGFGMAVMVLIFIIIFSALVYDVGRTVSRSAAILQSVAQLPNDSPHPVVKIDRSGIVLYANPASDALDGPWRCEVGRPAPECFARLVWETLDDGRARQVDIEAGSQVFSFALAPIAGGGYVNFYGHEITRRKEAEALLRLSEEKFAKAFASNPAALVITRLEDGLILDTNDTWEATFGYSRAEAIGHTSLSLHLWPTAEDRARCVAELRRKNSVRGLEQTLLRRSGEPFPALWSADIMSLAGERVILAAWLDISTHKQAEEQLQRHRTELAHVARLSMMGEIAASLAHELNQPLHAVSNYAQGSLLRLLKAPQRDDELADALNHIGSEATRAAEIVRRVRTFVEKREPQRSPVLVNRLVEEVILLSKAEIEQRHAEVLLELSENLPVVVGDSIQIEQVLMNLVRNGLEAMDDTPREKRFLHIKTLRYPDQMVQVEVSDCGKGIGPENREKVFTPFFTTKLQGMGMGLAISRSIVQAHGGRLWLSANEEQGCTFLFTLPAEQRELGND